MSPAVQSVLTSILMTLSTALATSAAAVGVITKDQETQFASIASSVALWAFSYGIAWYKKRMVAPKAMIAAVNSAYVPGVKVVAQGTSAPTVTAPIAPPLP